MTYKPSHEGPLAEPMDRLVKAVDALFNVERKLKRSAGGWPLSAQRDRLNKLIKRLEAKHFRDSNPAEWLSRKYFCEACKSVNCTHDEPLTEVILKGPVQSAPRRKR